MLLASVRAAPTVELAAARRQRAAGAPSPRAATTLVLFVGSGCRPAPAHSELLAREGMRCLWLPTLAHAIEAAGAARLDAVVLDATALEVRDAAALARARAVVQCPLVALADASDEVDEIVALELGADAYLLRPVSPRRLRAHLGALMRLQRTRPPSPAESPWVDPAPGDWRVDRVRNRLVRGTTAIALTDAQGAFLQCMLESRGRIVPRERLRAALPLGKPVHERSIDVYMHRLRKRLQSAGVYELLIEAIRGRGYVLQQQG